jgi:exodeoxyribonuclease VII large subunit
MHEFSVSQFLDFLNDAMRTIVDPQAVCVLGEVAEFKVSQGKWVWFKLKDDAAEGVMDCFWTTFGMREPLEDGMKIRAYGSPKVHPRSGKFSFNIVRVEFVGEGALKRSYELLKKKLSDEGLFDAARKRAIPRYPESIGLITSREAAACSDFLRILGNRWGGVTVRLASVAVQGERAVNEITGAFKYFNSLAEDARPQVLVLTRGGGSMEDMKAFNSEEVARAVYSSRIPVVCGVGHERDESLADWVADVRASTPSNAAERVVPDRRDVGFQVTMSARTISEGMQNAINRVADRITSFAGIAERFFKDRQRDVDHAVSAMRERFDVARTRFRERVVSYERLLANMNPELQMKRGWSVVRAGDGSVLRDTATVRVGDAISVRLWKGSFGAKVDKKDGGQTQLV